MEIEIVKSRRKGVLHVRKCDRKKTAKNSCEINREEEPIARHAIAIQAATWKTRLDKVDRERALGLSLKLVATYS